MQLGGVQRQDAMAEVAEILQGAMDLNLANESHAAKLHFFKVSESPIC